MFVPVWVIFLFTGLVMAVFAVTWGIRSRQFDDQQRARFLPLVGMDRGEIDTGAAASSHRAERAAVWILVAIGVAAMLSALVLTIRHI